MKNIFITLLLLMAATFAKADSLFSESFEYANHDGQTPVGWVCDDNSWLCGYLEKDHNRVAHTGNWYAYTDADDSWMFMEAFTNNDLKYRYYFWAISDGEYDIEFWLGNSPSVSGMTHQLFSETVSSGDYQHFAEYIESMPSNYQYFGIHAIAHAGAYHLTIDDIDIDMVPKYAITVDPATIDTFAAPGEQINFDFSFINIGYEPSSVIISPSSDYFTDIHIYKDGQACTTFYVEAFETLELTGVATLRPDIGMRTRVWADILFTLSCDCATTMFTLWATVGHESVEEYGISQISIYPNPSNGCITIEGDGAVTITNMLGQEVLNKQIVDKEIITLDKGIYFVRKDHGQSTKIIVE